jgi:uncharacterized protein YkwD
MTKKHLFAMSAVLLALASCKRDLQSDLTPTPVASSVQTEYRTGELKSTRTDGTDALTATTTLEAETAVLSGAKVASNQAGYTGTGFVDYINATGDYIEWTVNAPAAGSFLLQFRYANGGTTNRPLKLQVNGAVVAASLSFSPTGGWTKWTLSSSSANLIAGANKIRLTTIGSNGPNVDHLVNSATTTTTFTTQQQEVLTLINQRRAAGCYCGSTFYPKVAPLKLDSRLNTAATLHAQDMATNNYFSHTGRDGSQPWDRISRQGYSWSYAGENIAAGYSTSSAVVEGWINSPGHCANIMSPNFTDLGVGYSTGGTYRYYWVTNFARPR